MSYVVLLSVRYTMAYWASVFYPVPSFLIWFVWEILLANDEKASRPWAEAEQVVLTHDVVAGNSKVFGRFCDAPSLYVDILELSVSPHS